MDLEPSAEQAALVGLFTSIAERFSAPEAVRRNEPTGFSTTLWQQLGAAGAPAMGLPEQAGGGGATLLDLALVAEVLGRHLAPVPLVEHAVATRVLARFDRVTNPMIDGSAIATIALRPAIGGVARLVPAGAVADAVVVLHRAELVLLTTPPPQVAVPNLASGPIADRDVGDAEVLATGDEAQASYERALDEWRALTAAAVVGLGLGALSAGRAYVSERHQFGKPIGSFQAIQHALADAMVALDGAQLFARKAAWAIDHGRADAPDLAAMALLFAAEQAQRASERALHFHGGYGFMQEYDIQLYYRRAKGWPLVIGSPAAEYRRLATRRYGQPAGAR